jgi:hypothetical protein
MGSDGIQTAALSFGGDNTATTEEYDGSTWTAGGNMNTARGRLSGCGTQTAALGFGGDLGPGGGTPEYFAGTEEYDGSVWTITSSLPAPFSHGAGAGTQTAGLAFGGRDPVNAVVNSTYEFDAGGPATFIIGTD